MEKILLLYTLYFITKFNKKQVAGYESSLQVLQMRFSSKICGSDQSQQNEKTSKLQSHSLHSEKLSFHEQSPSCRNEQSAVERSMALFLCAHSAIASCNRLGV